MTKLPTYRQCKSCNLSKKASSFYLRKDNSKIRSICKECHSQYMKKYWADPKNKAKKKEWFKGYIAKNKNRYKDRHLKYTFDLPYGSYDGMLNKQKGKCAICLRMPYEHKRFAVDHNHKTGIIRGLLCDNCNVGLGKFFDNIKILTKAIRYLNE